MADRIENTVMNTMSLYDNPVSEPTIKNYFGLEGGANQLAYIITKQEGWFKEGSLTKELNNPGALKDPKTGVLKSFDTPKEGYEKLIYQLNLYATGKSTSGITPDDNISDFVDMYVAGGETKAYEENYEGHLGAYKKAIEGGLK